MPIDGRLRAQPVHRTASGRDCAGRIGALASGMTRVFIGYRRNDVAAQAGRVADRLRAHPSAPEVFHDTAEIRPGDVWKERIDSALAQCDVMLGAVAALAASG